MAANRNEVLEVLHPGSQVTQFGLRKCCCFVTNSRAENKLLPEHFSSSPGVRITGTQTEEFSYVVVGFDTRLTTCTAAADVPSSSLGLTTSASMLSSTRNIPSTSPMAVLKMLYDDALCLAANQGLKNYSRRFSTFQNDR